MTSQTDAALDLSAELVALARGSPAPAVAVVDRLLRAAAEARASDLHVDPEADAWVVRLRLDGVLHPAARLPRALAPTLVARLKVLADLPTYVVDAAQDGRIPAARAPGAAGDLRVAILPTIQGEKGVVRLFDGAGETPDLDALGYPLDAAQALERAVVAPQGVVVLSGPAGSGKSTTIHAALRRLRERSDGARSVVSIEDPVERVVPGITQCQVRPGFGWADALRAFLRQDPEVIHVGEVRDAATAAAAIEAGLTGHLVLTTLHAGSAAQVFTRLLDLRVEPHLVTSAVSAVFAQRLARRLCAACAVDDPRAAARAPLGREPRPRRAAGCPACLGTGHRGRLPLVEHAALSSAARRAVLERHEESALAAALREAGQRTLLERGLELVAGGVLGLAELERVLGPVGQGLKRIPDGQPM
jgi:type II secretory ATPase GspE/PulE/Tfp pilus assembly ATPase PilB-like protein